ncbi:hypothetical protein CBOM_07865 [Ceraceosorus bombacis]|uniref:Uncharacterized protein n=1 Tax=Ceraceosorus bombacis TaxID=401625 RepID=A0A0P1BR48_9BASI|nr:hypothetical protein CBOM_07865 [Ceraceosorus bombacis]
MMVPHHRPPFCDLAGMRARRTSLAFGSCRHSAWSRAQTYIHTRYGSIRGGFTDAGFDELRQLATVESSLNTHLTSKEFAITRYQ